MSDNFIKVWCQGGPADGWQYFTLVEPPSIIKLIPHPHQPNEWVRVTGKWQHARTYSRVPHVEQFRSERIYYPDP